jgi:hypothetical protein
MIRRVLTAGVVLLALESPAAAEGPTVPAPGSADTLFDEARHLRDEGNVTLACTRFAQSQKLAAGIGVTLYLADCYERLGRTASAWTEFRLAEKLANERGDKREAVAHAHAEALEASLSHLTIAVAPSLRGRSEVRLDGELVPAEAWNVAWPVDAGDHAVALTPSGQTPRVLTAHVEAGGPSVVVRFDEPDAVVPVTSPATATPPAAEVQPPAPPPSDPAATRRWGILGLLGAGVAGIGVGAGCLVAKNQSMSNGGPSGSPHQDDGAAMWSAVGFAGGGAALVSAVVLYLTAPASKDAAWSVSPAPMVGGAGAFLQSRF